MMGPRIYTYKITFPSQGWWYWGVHKERRYGEEYWGSPKAHAEKWKWFEFEKQILEFFDSYEEARKVEIRLIKPDLNNPLCLNESCGGEFSDSRLRGPMSEETKQKISRASKGKKNGPHSEETRRKIGKASKGRKPSEETRRKMSEAHMGKKRPPRSEEYRRKISEAQKGKKHTPESRKKIGGAFKGLAWFYDPVSKATKRCQPENCPEGYLRGRGQKR